MKFVYSILLMLFTLSAYQAPAQDDSFRKDRNRIWRKWNKKKQSYNPYLDKKAKNKPSAKLARQNKKDLKRKNRAVKKQKKRLSKKHP